MGRREQEGESKGRGESEGKKKKAIEGERVGKGLRERE